MPTMALHSAQGFISSVVFSHFLYTFLVSALHVLASGSYFTLGSLIADPYLTQAYWSVRWS
jgi:hypothetical protein